MDTGAPVANPHDALFRGVFADPARTAELVRSALPDEVTAGIDWASLQRLDASFVDEHLRDHQADLLFRATIADTPGYVYLLLEHKAGPDRFAVFQLLRYVVRIWESCRTDDPTAAHLPLVLPFVLHNGANPWSSPRSLHDLLPVVSPGLRALQPSFAIAVDDLGACDETTLHQRRLTVQTLLPLLHLQQLRRDTATAALLLSWRRLHLRLLAMPGGQQIVNRLCSYVAAVSNNDSESLRAAYARISTTTEERFMTIAERLKQEGRQEGRQEGHATTLLTLIEQRFGPLPPTVAQRIRDGSPAQLDHWTRHILTAPTIDDLLA